MTILAHAPLSTISLIEVPDTTRRNWPATRAGIAAALDRLGDDPDIIAKNLATLGIVGHHGQSDRCPIAKYLHTVMPGAYRVFVGSGHVRVFGAEHFRPTVDDDHLMVSLWVLGINAAGEPCLKLGPVGVFIHTFDQGGYPELHCRPERRCTSSPNFWVTHWTHSPEEMNTHGTHHQAT